MDIEPDCLTWLDPQPNRSCRTIYIQADHLGAPTAMTDATQRIVWQVRADAWGFIKATDAQAQDAVMNLRLPGQYFDAETGLHDNGHRSYDPRPHSAMRGNYLTPDPIGYPDGPDPYAYVGGDPVNKIDPSGLYEIDIHYYMTYFLGIVAGMGEADVRTMALATQFVDNNPATKPLESERGTLEMVQSIFHNQQQLKKYHFVLAGEDGKTLAQYKNANLTIADSPQLARLRKHAVPTEGCNIPNDQSLQFFGEYLHAFEDTYSHRNADNRPIDPIWRIGNKEWGVGHGYLGHAPDLTYDDHICYDKNEGEGIGYCTGWKVRESRTLAMEKATYGRIAQYMQDMNYQRFNKQSGKVTALDDPRLMKALQEFNAFKASEGEGSLQDKIAILDRALGELGYSQKLVYADDKNIDGSTSGYDQKKARENRVENQRDLKQDKYPGTILGIEKKP